MINTTEFGDLDAGDIYLLLNDVNESGDYFSAAVYTHGGKGELTWEPGTRVVVIGHKDLQPERPTAPFIIIHEGAVYDEPIPDGSTGISLGDGSYHISGPDGSYLYSFHTWPASTHIDDWEDAALVPVSVLKEARKRSDAWFGMTFDDSSDSLATAQAFDLLYRMARDYLPRETSNE